MNLKKGMVVRVGCPRSRPSGWNNDGEMDEYVNQLVILQGKDSYMMCTPLFSNIFKSNWTFRSSEFVKANTVMKTPKWAIEGMKNAILYRSSVDDAEEEDDDYTYDREEEEEYEREREEREEEERLEAEREEREMEEEERLAAEEADMDMMTWDTEENEPAVLDRRPPMPKTKRPK